MKDGRGTATHLNEGVQPRNFDTPQLTSLVRINPSACEDDNLTYSARLVAHERQANNVQDDVDDAWPGSFQFFTR